MEPANRLTTWGNSSSIPSGDTAGQDDQEQPLAHDGPVLAAGDELDPAGAVTARTVEAGPSLVGEGIPSDEEGGPSSSKNRGAENVADGESSGSELLPKRSKRSISVDSDELDQDTPATATPPPAKKKKKAKPGPLKPIASSMVCGECDKNFTVVGLIEAMWAER